MKKAETKNTKWMLKDDIESIRMEFPILDRSTYLISNSLGAVPRKAKEGLDRYFDLGAEEGVSAWKKEWWELSRQVGNHVGAMLGAGKDETTMLPNAAHCHWIALST